MSRFLNEQFLLTAQHDMCPEGSRHRKLRFCPGLYLPKLEPISSARQSIDIQKRLTNFKSQFGTLPSFGIPEGYFEPKGKQNVPQFDRDCNKVLDGFKSKFRAECGYSRSSYLDEFSLAKWLELSSLEKKQHTLSNCTRCYELHKEHQPFFPLKPIYEPKSILTINQDAFHQQGIKKFTTNVLSELNWVYASEANVSFTDALIKTKTAGLERKKTSKEKAREKRTMQKKITNKINEHFAENAAITLLTEGESKRKYHRKRLAQSFCSPETQPQPKKKKHSPNFETVTWDTEKLQATLQNCPPGTPINWSAVGQEHGIHGGNAGQIVREFAEEHKIDTTHIISSTPTRKPNRRPCKNCLVLEYLFPVTHHCAR